jgi:hypothetical protein
MKREFWMSKQTTTIDIRALRDHQVADVNGGTIPLSETRGQLEWSMTGGEDRVLIGRSEQVDLAKGISSNYACLNCCGNSFYDGWVTPEEVIGFTGDQTQLHAYQRDANCYGQPYLPYTVGAGFNSFAPSICDSTYGGLTTPTGLGDAWIQGGWIADAWYVGLNEQCEYNPQSVLRDAICQALQSPASLRVESVGLLPDGSGCPGSQDTGIKIGVTYQVLDLAGHAIARNDMVPQEKVTDTSYDGTSQGDTVPNWTDIGPSRISGTSRFTNEQGQFLDSPWGFCWDVPFDTYKFKQQISVLIGTRRFNVRTNNVTVTGTSLGHGTLTNALDIQKDRP